MEERHRGLSVNATLLKISFIIQTNQNS